jgi:hypothetical protein
MASWCSTTRAIRRHWTLVCCAFAFCWWHEACEVRVPEAVTTSVREKKSARALADAPPLAAPAARSAGMADAVRLAHALQARLLSAATAARRAAGIPVSPLRH